MKHEPMAKSSLRYRFSRFATWVVAFALMTFPAIATAQQPPTSASESGTDGSAQDQRPAPEGDLLAPKSLFQLYFAVKTAPGSGPSGTIRTVTTETFKLRVDDRINLTRDWQLVLRDDLPFQGKNPLNSSNPSGDYVYGVGDADIQATLINDIDTRWKAGFGARLIMPTGGDNLGSGKWQIMPIVSARYSMPDVGSGLLRSLACAASGVAELVSQPARLGGKIRRQKVNRNPAVGATLLVWKNPLARPPVTCDQITPA
jgi:hypothetical protein